MPKCFYPVCLAVVLLFGLGGISTSYASISSGQDSALLERALLKAGDYCERLKAAALHFVCHENIKERLEETLISHTGKRFPKYQVSIIYDHFRFFAVETEIKYQGTHLHYLTYPEM